MSGIFPPSGGGGGGTTPPTTPPTDPNQGLMPQTADPFAVYGQMGVMEPYLSLLNQRFGWDPAGIATGQQLSPTLPSFYQPNTIYPKTILPAISGAAGAGGTTPTPPKPSTTLRPTIQEVRNWPVQKLTAADIYSWNGN